MKRAARGSAWIGPLGLLLAGCASNDAGRGPDEGVAAALADAGDRVGLSLPSPPADDAEVDRLVADQLTRPLTDDDAIRIACLNDRRLRAAYEDIGIARGELVQAGLLRNPVLSAQWKIFSPGDQVELSLAQPFLDLFLRPLREAEARAGLEEARLALTSRVIGVAFDVRRALVDVRAAEAKRARRTASLDAAAAARELTATLRAAGNVPDLEQLNADAAVARARIDLARAESEDREARERLAARLGLFGAGPRPDVAGGLDDVAPADPAPDLDRVESRAVAASLDLAVRRARIDRLSQTARRVSWTSFLPDADAGIAFEREVDGETGVGPEASITLPLFDTGAAAGAIAAARIRREADLYYADAVEIRSAARRLRDRWVERRELAAYLTRSLLPLERQRVDETVRNYNAMQIGAFQVLDAQRVQIDVEAQRVRALRDAEVARLDLEELLAGVLDRERVDPVEHHPDRDDDRPMSTSRREH